MKHLGIKQLITGAGRRCAIVAMAGILLGATGCIRDGIDVPEPTDEADAAVTMQMIVPNYEVPQTRSIEDGGGESEVFTIHLLVFDTSSPAILMEHQIGGSISTEPSGSDYKVTFKASLTPSNDPRTIVAVVNSTQQVTGANLTPGMTKPEVLEKLKYVAMLNSGLYNWDVSASYTPIPMYGEIAVSKITSGSTISNLRLTRSVARIDVKNDVVGSVFNLKNIYVVNYNTVGYLAPPWNTTTGALLQNGDPGYPYTNNLNPPIPNPAGKPGNSLANAMQYSYSQSNSAAGPLMAGTIYTFEAEKATESEALNATNAVCLIVKGTYGGKDYFYRIDFTQSKPGTAPHEVEYVPLYRNHKYVITIMAAEGIGFETFDQAVNSTTTLSNLKTRLLVVDMAGINEIVYNGQHFMGVESRNIEVGWGVKGSIEQLISTNYTGEWKAEILDKTQTWLRFPGNQTVVTDDDLNSTPLTLDLAALTTARDPNNNYVSTQVLITAGRLTMVLTLTRGPMAKEFARSNVVMKDGILTFAVTEADNQTMPAYSQGAFFKWGSLVAIGPAGIPYAPGTHVIYNPSTGNPTLWGAGMAGWDKIPYAHPNFGFTGSVAVGGTNPNDDLDEFENYNTSGFNKNLGVGDICRYIASADGKAKWVEGNWRLPTLTELKMLYAESDANQKKGGLFTNLTATLNASPGGTNNLGFYNPASGWWLGSEVTAATNNMAAPPVGTVFLPATGLRYPNGDGDVVHVGAYGYYWSSTPYYSRVTANYLFLNESATTGVYDNDADRSYAFPIRCIRDY